MQNQFWFNYFRAKTHGSHMYVNIVKSYDKIAVHQSKFIRVTGFSSSLTNK